MKPVEPVKKLAKKGKVPVKVVKQQVKMGKKVEKEHTDSPKKAEKVAKQHVYERPDYYTQLKKMEKKPVKISGKEDWKKYASRKR
jgi:hypothetical protein